jgi:hypothetical protein
VGPLSRCLLFVRELMGDFVGMMNIDGAQALLRRARIIRRAHPASTLDILRADGRTLQGEFGMGAELYEFINYE